MISVWQFLLFLIFFPEVLTLSMHCSPDFSEHVYICYFKLGIWQSHKVSFIKIYFWRFLFYLFIFWNICLCFFIFLTLCIGLCALH